MEISYELIEKSARINDSQACLLNKDVPIRRVPVSEMTEQLEANSHGECVNEPSE
jgi:hypothetical protein